MERTKAGPVAVIKGIIDEKLPAKADGKVRR